MSSTTIELQGRYDSLLLLYEKRLSEYNSLGSSLLLLRSEDQSLCRRIDDLEKISLLLRTCGESISSRLSQVFEGLVTFALRQIYGGAYSFELKFDLKNRARVVEPLVDDGYIKAPPDLTRGGSLKDLVSVVFRIIFLLLYRPNLRRVLVLDECFAGMSENLVPRVAQFLGTVCERTGLQILLVTHKRGFVGNANSVFIVTKSDGQSHLDSVDPSSVTVDVAD